jgi:hypothetical protein
MHEEIERRRDLFHPDRKTLPLNFQDFVKRPSTMEECSLIVASHDRTILFGRK